MPDIDRGPLTLDDLEGRNFAYPHEVARILRTDVRTVRRAINDGQIPATKVGAAYRVPVAWLRQAAAGSGAGITVAAGGQHDAVPAGSSAAALRRA